MMVLQVSGLRKEYGGVPVLSGVSFDLAGGERVGLVGANGCGKSTLIKMLAGVLPADGGNVHWVHEGLRTGYLSQEDHWDPHRTLSEQVGAAPPELLARCGVTDNMLSRPAGTLSGGQKVRAALARVLAGRPQVLLLDEPTNHLDTEALTWLESLLVSFRGAVLVVSHDRYFLDRVATRILELEGGVGREYRGNYSAFAAQKQMELERAVEEYRHYRNEKKRLEEAIRRQVDWAVRGHFEKVPRTAPMGQKAYNQGQAQAHMRQAKSMQKRLDRMRVEKPRAPARVNLKFEGVGDVARNLVLAENLGFTYDGRRWLFRGAGFYLQRGERLAVVGPNGVGKTTLLRLLLGQLQPSEGSVYLSPVRVAYLAQELETLNPQNTVLVEATGDSAMDQAEARTLLGCLLFSRDAVLKRVGVLSRGEKVRLTIAKILLSNPDLLVLDEPTNGLDLPSRERVEEALEGYPGTMLLVSHDRYLLRRLATRVLAVGDGRAASFTGGYEAFAGREKRVADDGSERLLLETRLAQLSAALATASAGEAQALNEEFFAVSRALRALKG